MTQPGVILALIPWRTYWLLHAGLILTSIDRLYTVAGVIQKPPTKDLNQSNKSSETLEEEREEVRTGAG